MCTPSTVFVSKRDSGFGGDRTRRNSLPSRLPTSDTPPIAACLPDKTYRLPKSLFQQYIFAHCVGAGGPSCRGLFGLQGTYHRGRFGQRCPDRRKADAVQHILGACLGFGGS